MPTPVQDKYYLKSLHEEIALFDRKLAHLLRYETFSSEKDRNAAAAKMSVKRGQLVQTARKLAESGITFQPTDLPRSMRPEDFTPLIADAESAPSAAIDVLPSQPQEPVDGQTRLTTSSFREEIQEYLTKRKKARQN